MANEKAITLEDFLIYLRRDLEYLEGLSIGLRDISPEASKHLTTKIEAMKRTRNLFMESK